jgi:phosphopantetheinyl transferase
MQAVESQTLILYHTDLRGEWPGAAARALAVRLPYLKRLAAGSGGAAARASLAGIALALRALARLTGHDIAPRDLTFVSGEKPGLARSCGAGPDFSISHAGPWVGCAALAGGRVGLDIEIGSGARIAEWVRCEALLKAAGAGLRALSEVRAAPSRGGRVRWRDESWHERSFELFPGAMACVMTSVAAVRLEERAVELAELFGS